jgi:hypothetical protein
LFEVRVPVLTIEYRHVASGMSAFLWLDNANVTSLRGVSVQFF